MNWDSIVDRVRPYLLKIETPQGSGTGFLFAYGENKSYCTVATALHVVADADNWKQPIRLYSDGLEKTAFLREGDRVIFRDEKTDSAAILLDGSQLKLPEALINLRPIDTPLSIGCEVGWLGYPAIEPNTLTFFSGNVGARRRGGGGYLIDGVAINGVSGGPVIHNHTGDQIEFVGIITAYWVNRQHGDALPGLSIAQDVSHFHFIVSQMKNIDEAARQQAQLEANKQKEQSSTTITPATTQSGQ